MPTPPAAHSRWIASALLLVAASASATASASPKPAKLGLCVACHGETGRSRIAGTPHLAGQDETYLVNALHAYRAGRRRHEPMGALANSLQPRDISALARWYSRQTGFQQTGLKQAGASQP